MLERAREVLEIEAGAILALKDRLDESFASAVRLITECKGRVVVTGMGKSGAIARKIAGTLASTGSPALFLHPAEGVHGDLGMVTSNDIVIALSNSGETDELSAILPVLKRMGAKLISLIGRPDSTLGKASDVVLDVSVEKEACPLGLAPTASTTVMLALGDALALGAMEARKFTAEDYAVFHPAGALGRRLSLTVADVMRTDDWMATCFENDLVRDVLFAITKAGAGAAAITDSEGRLAGIITDGDVRRHILADERCLSRKAHEIMIRTPKTISPEAFATEGMKILEDFKIGELPVLDGDRRPVGMLMMKDLFRAGIV
ncbi:MAG TPA: KpsF/GutQ family sugar-phosphate isomerase [Armatimonadota bacterium]|nr:KpsF/GutQ family sugar-phosphate isomerase [Armatimonadota bacterium]